jgi:hypothetical protein
MFCIGYAAIQLQPLKVRANYSLLLPNKWNFSYDLYYLLWIWILTYFPGRIN